MHAQRLQPWIASLPRAAHLAHRGCVRAPRVAQFSHKRAIMYRTTLLPLTMIPPVISEGKVPEWLYPLALRMQVTGFIPPALKGILVDVVGPAILVALVALATYKAL